MALSSFRCDIDKKIFYFSVSENGRYNICAMENGEILLTETDWDLVKGVGYFLAPWSKNGLKKEQM